MPIITPISIPTATIIEITSRVTKKVKFSRIISEIMRSNNVPYILWCNCAIFYKVTSEIIMRKDTHDVLSFWTQLCIIYNNHGYHKTIKVDIYRYYGTCVIWMIYNTVLIIIIALNVLILKNVYALDVFNKQNCIREVPNMQ